jgi:hypothetical protein
MVIRWNDGDKSISVNFHPQHWNIFQSRDNGYVVGDSCYDYNLWFFGVCFSYTNWNCPNQKLTPKEEKLKERKIKIDKILNE